MRIKIKIPKARNIAVQNGEVIINMKNNNNNNNETNID